MPNLLLDPAQRSYMMSRIRSKETAMERLVFRELRSRGVYFRKHYERAPGKPDVARPREKKAVFIDGDFWHGRELDRIIEKHGPESHWAAKLERNIERDREQDDSLKVLGWRVLRVWESDLRRVGTRQKTLDSIESFLTAG